MYRERGLPPEYWLDMPAEAWRMIGAAAFALVNKRVVPRAKEIVGDNAFGTWTRRWQTPTAYHVLKLREATTGQDLSSTLYSLYTGDAPPVMAEEIHFWPNPETTSRLGPLVVLQTLFDAMTPRQFEYKIVNRSWQSAHGLATPNITDFMGLYEHLTIGALCPALTEAPQD
jgi:hypothetical protein